MTSFHWYQLLEPIITRRYMMTSRGKSFREMKFSHLLNGDFKPAIVMSYRKQTECGTLHEFAV
jgi:hypothetical protein